MLKYIRKNIDQAQELSKIKLNSVLLIKGYSIIKDEINKKGVETRLIIWTNNKKNHSICLLWDSREQYFDLGYYNSTINLNLRNWSSIGVVCFNSTKLFFRKKYYSRISDEIINKLNQKLPPLRDD